jgi:flagellar motor switch protein FliG
MAATAIAPPLSGVQKAAILLIALGDEVSSGLLKQLSDEEVALVTGVIANLPIIPLQQAESILEEFHYAANSALQMARGGTEYARRILTHAFGPEASKKHLDRLPQHGQTTINQQLQRIDPEVLASFVNAEHPQTAALILSRVSPAQSAAVLAAMDPQARTDIAVRIATLNKISPAVVAKISTILGAKLKSSTGEVQRESAGGPRAAAQIFNQMDPALCDEILQQIGQQNAELVELIRNKMFVFEDLLTLDSAGVTELLSRADRRQLMIALKGATPELREFLLKGLSQRGAEMLLEDMEALGPVKIRDVEAAQQTVIAVVRQLETDGVISRNRTGEKNDQYV